MSELNFSLIISTKLSIDFKNYSLSCISHLLAEIVESENVPLPNLICDILCTKQTKNKKRGPEYFTKSVPR